MKRGSILAMVAVFALTAALAHMAIAQGSITRDNWGEAVGFKPDLAKAPDPGMTINSANMDQYGALIPEGAKVLMKKYNYSFTTKAYEPWVPADTYIAATNANVGKTKVTDVSNPRQKGIDGYVAGLPFPHPKDGLEVAWNYNWAYGGDDARNLFSVYWISAKGGVERSEDWTWLYINRAVGRTDINPKPAIKEALDKGIQYYSVTTALTPLDKKGFSALYTRMIEPKDQQGFIYIPAQRKSTRFAFGTRGDAWNNTDLLYEDVRGYLGYPEWMNWSIKEKTTMLMPMHSGIKHGKDQASKTYDFNTAPHWNFDSKWEMRPTYVLEVTAKFKDYPYSKMVFYVDAESYYITVKDAYDKKGQLWKVLVNAWNASANPRSLPPAIGASLVVDLQSEHATAFAWQKAEFNVGLVPDEFTLARLRKIGN
ncbi:MAG: DUF1329 domain-containing protein [Deltaproteobacteria bacterium]|nr:DUF1329 domain-containing protein [bacterium]MCB9478558.1 DUF1329 domain-containing protein [Deltaproteobacteria bacterium]MCB9488361.1 DUF1329 domain-containing protein [Deltaproteobacteria bacterium]